MIIFSGRLFPVEIGQTITVVGRASNHAQRIDIDLLSGNNHGVDAGDIQLHMSARFQANDTSIVRNTHVRGAGWLQEERRENLIPFNTLNPIKKGGDFKVAIFIDQSAFFVSFDEKPYCTFAHRLPIVGIQRINIARDIDEIYQMNQRSAQPSPWPIVKTNIFQSFAPRQFNPGNVIVITGVPRGSPNGDFSINFYDGPNKARTHFHLRIYPNQKKIVINSQQENGNWHTPIASKPSHFPFIMLQTFKIAIAITSSNFMIAANGLRFAQMPFRDEIKRLLGSMTGFEVIGNNNINLGVPGVEHLVLDTECNNFERFSSMK